MGSGLPVQVAASKKDDAFGDPYVGEVDDSVGDLGAFVIPVVGIHVGNVKVCEEVGQYSQYDECAQCQLSKYSIYFRHHALIGEESDHDPLALVLFVAEIELSFLRIFSLPVRVDDHHSAVTRDYLRMNRE